MSSPPSDQWQGFRESRPAASHLYLDCASAGRSSRATLSATAAHAEREAAIGGYLAAAEAEGTLSAGREALARLLGMEAGGIAFTESATAALATLLRSWPVTVGDAVAVLPGEWGPALDAFTDRGLRVHMLDAGPDGVIDLQALRVFLVMTPPAFVHLDLVASHRPLVQPAAAAVAICHAAGVPVWVDAAQGLGHVDAACGADVVYATSRKWLCGPRGVGIIGVASPWWRKLRPRASAMDRGGLPPEASPVVLMQSREAHVAGRIGLCAAVDDHLSLGPAAVRERLAAVGRMAREVLADVPGWEVVPAPEGPAGESAITALRPAAGQDVFAVRAQLLAEQHIVTTAASVERAPREMREPYLRVSPHVDCTAEDLDLLKKALPAS